MNSKTHFWSIFPNLGAKNVFPENPALSRTTSYGFLALCQNSEKTIIQLQENIWTEGRTKGRTDSMTFWLPPEVQFIFK